MEEWKTYRLGEVADVQTGPFGSQLHNEDYVPVGTPIVTVEHLGARRFSEQNLPYVSKEDCKRLEKYTLREGDIVFSRVGSVDRCSYVSSLEDGWLFSGRCLRVRPGELVHPLYLYYFFQKESVKQEIRNVAVGATMPSINTKLLSDLTVTLPSYTEQKRIASALSSIDDKIELNNRINHNLERLLDSYFEDLLKQSCRSIPLSEVCETIKDGVHNTVIDCKDGPFYLLSCKNIKDGHITIGNDERRISNSTFEKLRRRTQLSKWDILLSSVGTIGELVLLKEQPDCFEFQRSVAIIKPAKRIGPFAVYSALRRQKAEIIHAAHGAVQQCLFLSDINKFKIVVPSSEASISAFNEHSLTIHCLIEEREKENRALTSIRERILPELLSGKIDAF